MPLLRVSGACITDQGHKVSQVACRAAGAGAQERATACEPLGCTSLPVRGAGMRALNHLQPGLPSSLTSIAHGVLHTLICGQCEGQGSLGPSWH